MAKKKRGKSLPQPADGTKLIARNKRAFHDYEVLQAIECGMVLCGSEVKSLRDGNVSFADSYATVRDGELFLIGLNIGAYAMASLDVHTAAATRKLLVHKRQIRKLKAALVEKGLTLVPLDLHWRRGLAKVELGVVRGKAQYDKRHTIRDREAQRTRQRALRKSRDA